MHIFIFYYHASCVISYGFRILFVVIIWWWRWCHCRRKLFKNNKDANRNANGERAHRDRDRELKKSAQFFPGFFPHPHSHTPWSGYYFTFLCADTLFPYMHFHTFSHHHATTHHVPADHSAEIKTLHTHTPSNETFSWFFCQFSGFLFAHTFFTSAHIFNIANWNVLTERLQYSNGGVYWFLIYFFAVLPFCTYYRFYAFSHFSYTACTLHDPGKEEEHIREAKERSRKKTHRN